MIKTEEKRQWLIAIIIAATVFVFIKTFGFKITRVTEYSMEPTYVNGEIVFTSILSYKISNPERGDIVVFKHDGDDYIKRVIALPRDEVDFYFDEENDCYYTVINGEMLFEEYIKSPVDYIGEMEYPLVLGEGEYFCMGDNRTVSIDSRDFGAVEKETFVGKVVFKIVSK